MNDAVAAQKPILSALDQIKNNLIDVRTYIYEGQVSLNRLRNPEPEPECMEKGACVKDVAWEDKTIEDKMYFLAADSESLRRASNSFISRINSII